mmetsp:Transcript_35542/g.77259  ORF Transcript_35542/g.77259 Transcript_35542/m.77259 type:complete len:510 (+) Transcript_35542:832-2361(+)
MPDHCLGEPQHVFGVLRGGSEYVFSAVVGLGQPFHLHAGNCPFVCLLRRRGLSFAAGVHLLKGPRHVRVPLLHAGIHHRCRQHLASDQPDRGHVAVSYCLQLVHIVQIQHVIQCLKQIIQELHHQGRIHVLGEAREADDVREHDADAIVPAGQVLVPTRNPGPSYRSFRQVVQRSELLHKMRGQNLFQHLLLHVPKGRLLLENLILKEVDHEALQEGPARCELVRIGACQHDHGEDNVEESHCAVKHQLKDGLNIRQLIQISRPLGLLNEEDGHGEPVEGRGRDHAHERALPEEDACEPYGHDHNKGVPEKHAHLPKCVVGLYQQREAAETGQLHRIHHQSGRRGPGLVFNFSEIDVVPHVELEPSRLGCRKRASLVREPREVQRLGHFDVALLRLQVQPPVRGGADEDHQHDPHEPHELASLLRAAVFGFLREPSKLQKEVALLELLFVQKQLPFAERVFDEGVGERGVLLPQLLQVALRHDAAAEHLVAEHFDGLLRDLHALLVLVC